ncbi:MAG TPA: FmdB family zinc ribbon protein [Chloroflexota bacterium]|nr:FmdB family zinc ribbon protein [Chloroflexota bacterium]
MPIYVYRCADCAAETEKRQGFSDAPLTTCEACGGGLRRVLQPAGVIFKGSGFYSTDYRNGANGKKSATDGESSAKTSENGASAKSENSDSAPAKAESGEKKAAPAATGSTAS